MKQYGITEIARLFGVSTETIRKYEKKGMLTTARNDKNHYRKYDSWDVVSLFQTRTLRHLGFSLSEAERFLNEGNILMRFHH